MSSLTLDVNARDLILTASFPTTRSRNQPCNKADPREDGAEKEK